MNYQDYITIEPGKPSGKPCIRDCESNARDCSLKRMSGVTEPFPRSISWVRLIGNPIHFPGFASVGRE